MRSIKATTMLDYHLVSGYEKLQQKLLSPKFADRLDKPLAFWALPADRHLPLALVGRTLQELLSEPFEEIYSTPGIGPKKISTLLKLLNRAAQPLPPGAIPPSEAEVAEDEPAAPAAADGKVDVRNVSDALWITWRDSVRDHGLGDSTLGRFASSLQRLPRVLWAAPLNSYLHLSLSEIRQLKTHGEKRVRSVLEVFGALHQIIVRLGAHSSLAVRITPKSVAHAESWIASALQRSVAPPPGELQEHLLEPMLEQLRTDAGEQLEAVARSRIAPANFSVQQTARQFGMTRARVYEVLSDAPTVIGIRWPEGRFLVGSLGRHLAATHADADLLKMLAASSAVLFGQPAAGGEDALSVAALDA